jgi:hypothetical protein
MQITELSSHNAKFIFDLENLVDISVYFGLSLLSSAFTGLQCCHPQMSGILCRLFVVRYCHVLKGIELIQLRGNLSIQRKFKCNEICYSVPRF